MHLSKNDPNCWAQSWGERKNNNGDAVHQKWHLNLYFQESFLIIHREVMYIFKKIKQLTLFETSSIPTEKEMTNLWRAVAPEIPANCLPLNIDCNADLHSFQPKLIAVDLCSTKPRRLRPRGRERGPRWWSGRRAPSPQTQSWSPWGQN